MENIHINKILSVPTASDTKRVLDFVNSSINATRSKLQYCADNTDDGHAYQKEFMYRILFDLVLSEDSVSIANTNVLYNTEDINKLRLLTRGNVSEGYNCFFQEESRMSFTAPEAKVIKASRMNCELSDWLAPSYKKTYVITKNMKADFGILKSPYDPTSRSLLIPLIMRNIDTFLVDNDKTTNTIQFEYDSVLYTLKIPLNAHAVKVKLLDKSHIMLFFDPCNMTKEELSIMFNYAQNMYNSIMLYSDFNVSIASFTTKYICKYAFEDDESINMHAIIRDGITKDIQDKFPDIDISSIRAANDDYRNYHSDAYESIIDYTLDKVEDLSTDYFNFISHSVDDWNTKGYNYHEIQD